MVLPTYTVSKWHNSCLISISVPQPVLCTLSAIWLNTKTNSGQEEGTRIVKQSQETFLGASECSQSGENRRETTEASKTNIFY